MDPVPHVPPVALGYTHVDTECFMTVTANTRSATPLRTKFVQISTMTWPVTYSMQVSIVHHPSCPMGISATQLAALASNQFSMASLQSRTKEQYCFFSAGAPRLIVPAASLGTCG